ncbi:MAG: DUF3149 domain-containing protein [Betaproteobacteria bacterium]
MDAWKELFMTPVGLLSLGVIVFTIGMGVWFSRWFAKKIEEDERNRGKV